MFFKQKTAYEMRISDWSSDVCSSDLSISNLSKTYASGFQALKSVSLDIHRGEIFALLGPNGAGKTTLISIVCGIVNPSQGHVSVDGHEIGRASCRERVCQSV